MSESFATNRPAGGAEEFERRRRSLPPAADKPVDPLTELARLVGQADPFRGLSPQVRSTVTEPQAPAPAQRETAYDHRKDFAGITSGFRGAIDAGEEPGAPDEPSVVHPDLHPVAGTLRGADLVSRGPRAPVVPEINPDRWAHGVDFAAPAIEPQMTATRDDTPGAAAEGGSAKRTLIVLAAVVALTGGGLAASFLAKPSGNVMLATSSAATPTILAATGPAKVQPETQATNGDAPSEPSTLLDKNNGDGTASAKVVNSVEQPVDLAQAVKPAAGAAAPAAEIDRSASASPFPEPRKVKTILVRPDGTIITDRVPAPVADSPAPSTPAGLAFDPQTSLPLAPGAPPAAAGPAQAASPPVVPAPATVGSGKSQARVAVTPRAGQDEVSGARATAAKPAPAKPKPVEQAEATPAADTATASLPSGKFAAQLGAAGSEAEARDLSSRLSRKYADTIGGKLSVHQGQSGSKTVYRVRAAGLTQEAAKAICAKVTSGGGGCFVARD